MEAKKSNPYQIHGPVPVIDVDGTNIKGVAAVLHDLEKQGLQFVALIPGFGMTLARKVQVAGRTPDQQIPAVVLLMKEKI